MIFLSLLFLFIGALMLFKPSVFWQITESYKSKSTSGPTDFYIWTTRFGGVMLTLVGFALIIVVIFE